MFDRIHVLSIVLSVLACIFLPVYITSLRKKLVEKIIFYLSLLVMMNIFVWMGLEWAAGTFDLKSHLPLHLCRVANILLPVMVISGNKTLYNVLYYWSLSGIFQALITPDLLQTFPHYHFFRFFITHNMLIFVILLYSKHKKIRPTKAGIWIALFYMNIFLLVVFVVNTFLGSNYFWIMEKPSTASLLDYLGPWPWYILWAEFVALLHFGAAYMPVLIEKRFINRRNRKKFNNFSEFYPYYIYQHQVFMNRFLHNVGSTIVLLLLFTAFIANKYLLILMCPIVGYSFAWLGHYFIEKNKPATFSFPLYSFIGDWVMLIDSLRGKDFNKIICKFRVNEKI